MSQPRLFAALVAGQQQRRGRGTASRSRYYPPALVFMNVCGALAVALHMDGSAEDLGRPRSGAL